MGKGGGGWPALLVRVSRPQIHWQWLGLVGIPIAPPLSPVACAGTGELDDRRPGHRARPLFPSHCRHYPCNMPSIISPLCKHTHTHTHTLKWPETSKEKIHVEQ